MTQLACTFGVLLLGLASGANAQAACGVERLAGMEDGERIDMRTLAGVDQYLAGDWDGDGIDEIAARVSNDIYVDVDGDSLADLYNRYGVGKSEDQYLAGDWNNDGCTNLAVRRGPNVLMDYGFDGTADSTTRELLRHNSCDLLSGRTVAGLPPSLLVLCQNEVLVDSWPWNGKSEGEDMPSFKYGGGCAEDEYLVGDFGNTGIDTLGVRRDGSTFLLNFGYDGSHDVAMVFGDGSAEEYFVGDWDGDGFDNIAYRVGSEFYFDTNFDSAVELTQTIGSSQSIDPGCGSCS